MKMAKRLCALIMCLLMITGAACAQRLTDEQLYTYFSDAIVVGDSLPRMLKNYIADMQEKNPAYFAGMRFFTYYSYRLKTTASEKFDPDDINLMYKSKHYTLYQLVDILKPGKVFILAGLNDKIGEKPEVGMEYVETIVSLMEKHAPDTQVYFFSLTPVTYRVEQERPNLQQKWDAYNQLLKAKCEEVGALYVEISEPLKNENGLLPMALSHDGKYHLNEEGNAIWAQLLLDYAQSRYDAGLWSPENGGF